jgi:Cd2+/Zn2+-exporting ATPase
MTKLTYYIQGMDCNEEVTALKKALMPLVKDEKYLAFDLIKAKLTVTIPRDSNSGHSEILDSIKQTGMTALRWEDYVSADKKEIPFWKKHGRSVMCSASGLFLITGFTVHAILHGFFDAIVSGADGVHTYPAVSIVFYTIAVITGGWFVAPKAVLSVRIFRPDMSLLMSVAVIGAIVLGEYFEASAIIFLFSFSLLQESWSVGRARRAISALIDLSPAMARYLSGSNNEILESPVELVPVGATVLVRPGEKIPLDGVVTKGGTAVDQSPITGESMPVEKSEGDDVFAGTINGNSAIEIRTTNSADDSTISRIIRMVDEAHSRKAPSEQWVEKFARYYTPIMLALAVFIALVPPLFAGGEWSSWFYRSLVLLVIACPCALVISTPVSIIAALTATARAGVLIKGGIYLEKPAHLGAIVFDKTGTLTYGSPSVQEIIPMDDHSEQDLLRCAAALEMHSTHPYAGAILGKAKAAGINIAPAEEFTLVQGKGAEGKVNGRKYWIGSHRFMHEKGSEPPDFHKKAEELEAQGKSVIAMGTDDHVCGLISLADEVKDTSRSTIEAIKSLGIKRVVMLTGDNQETARVVAQSLGIEEFESDLLPEDKVKIVERLVEQHGEVAMVGDGVNDAPALAMSSLGIAMGAAGTDAAIETADIALMSDDITKIPWLIGYSRRTLRVIKQNISFALGLKLLFIILALFEKASLWMAIAADMGATFIVIFNSLRLLNGKS